MTDGSTRPDRIDKNVTYLSNTVFRPVVQSPRKKLSRSPRSRSTKPGDELIRRNYYGNVVKHAEGEEKKNRTGPRSSCNVKNTAFVRTRTNHHHHHHFVRRTTFRMYWKRIGGGGKKKKKEKCVDDDDDDGHKLRRAETEKDTRT